MGRFPLFRRLLLVMILGTTKMTTGEEVWSEMESEWKSLNVTDSVPSRSAGTKVDTASPPWSKNVTVHKMEKAILSFPDPVDCDSDRVGKGTAPNVTAILAKIKEIKVNPEISGCQTSVLSELLTATENLFSRSPSCAPSWSRLRANNLWGNESAAFLLNDKRGGRSSVWMQKGIYGRWMDTTFRNITGMDCRFVFELSVKSNPNTTFPLSILVDHFIGGDFTDVISDKTKVSGAGQDRTGELFIRVYMPLENGTANNETPELETPVHTVTFPLNFTKCDDVFVVERFFKDVIENGWRAASKKPSPEPKGSGWASSPWMICFYVLLTLTVLSLGGIFLVKWIKTFENPCDLFTLQFYY